MIDLSIILVNYNVKTYLAQAMASIEKALEGLQAEVIVVDNASRDGSVPMLRSRFPTVRLIVNSENVGFAKANNQAIRVAQGRYLCLINPDTLVREDTFRVCVGYLDVHPEVGMVGGKVLNPDGTLQLACRRSFPTPWVAFTKVSGLSTLFPKSRLFGRYNLTFLDPNQPAEVDAISGSFMVVRRETIERVGLLDERFFMYGEDLDWCYRIRQEGWKIVYLPETQIIHYKGRSTQESSVDAIRLFYGAMALFVKKHAGRGFSRIPQGVLLIAIWIRGVLGFLLDLTKRLTRPGIDLLLIQLGLGIALIGRFGDLGHWVDYRVVNAIYTTVWMACLAAMGLYRHGVFSISLAMASVMLGLILNASITFFLPQYAYSRQVLLFWGLSNLLFLTGWRLGVRLGSGLGWFPWLRRIGHSWLIRRAVVLGDDASTADVYRRLKSRISSSYELVGVLVPDEGALESWREPDVPVIGTVTDLNRLIRVYRIDEVIFTPEASRYETILSVIASTQGCSVDFKMVPRDLDVLIGRSAVDALEEVPLLDLDYRIDAGFNPVIKRIEDLLFAGIFLILSLPLLLWIGIDPRWRSVRLRISDGREGCFDLVEFQWRDRRVGGWIGLIPRMWEVLRGKMSLVGTEIRPCRSEEKGLGYKPGITGIVQIRADASCDETDRLRLTLFYLKNYSILLDLEILVRSLILKSSRKG